MGHTRTKVARNDKAGKRREGAEGTNYRFRDKRSVRSNRRRITGRALTNVALRNAGVITCRDPSLSLSLSFFPRHLRLSRGRQIVAEPRRSQRWMYRSVNCERAKVFPSPLPLINVSFKATTGRLAGSPGSSLSPLVASSAFSFSRHSDLCASDAAHRDAPRQQIIVFVQAFTEIRAFGAQWPRTDGLARFPSVSERYTAGRQSRSIRSLFHDAMIDDPPSVARFFLT